MKGDADEPFSDEPSSSRHQLVCSANRYRDDGRTGLLVPERDPAALADALATLLSDADRRARIGRAARQEVCERYTWERYAQRLEDVFDLAIERERTTMKAEGIG